MQWVTQFKSDLEAEKRDEPGICSLATVDGSSAPHVRSVVVRILDDAGMLWTTMDLRSDKTAQLRHERRVELMCWLSRTQNQYRFAGLATLIEDYYDRLRADTWTKLPERTRATFFWPTPGIAFSNDDEFPNLVASSVAPPKHFALLGIAPIRVERLNLKEHPHSRRVWRADAEWQGVEINP